MRSKEKTMKYLLLFLMFVAPALAQAEDRFGVIGGMNLASLRGEGSDAEMHAFPMVGVYADFGIDDTSYINPQIRYMQKGAGARSDIGSLPLDISLSLKYIELPIYYKYKFPGGTTFRPNLFVGPAFGVRVGDTFTIKQRNTGQVINVRGAFGSSLKKIDFAAEAGAGVEFTLGESTVGSFNAAYSHGLLNIAREGTAVKTQGIQIYGGIGF
jgi:hypothetical protein